MPDSEPTKRPGTEAIDWTFCFLAVLIVLHVRGQLPKRPARLVESSVPSEHS